MDGRKVVGIMGVLVVATAGLFWKVGLDVKADVDAQAARNGVARLSDEEAAARVAREDVFGLPSHLADPPRRDIERPWFEGTTDNPFPVSPEGVAALFEVYHVTVKGCRSQLPAELRDAPIMRIYVTIATLESRGRVVGVDAVGDAVKEAPFTKCLAGGVGPATFEVPDGGERTIGYALPLQDAPR